MRVVIAGAAGSIGAVVTRGLVERGHEVVGIDRVPWDAPDGVRAVVGDVLDQRTLLEALPGADAVVHLASLPAEATLPVILESHVHTTAALLDGMVDLGIARFVYASSNHAVGSTPRTDLLPVETPPRPDSFYGVGKVAGEALGRLYVDRYGIGVVACRIGSFTDRPRTRRQLSTWLSHGDAVRMVAAAVAADGCGFAPIYGISANTRGWWDLEPGRALGYHPRDDAEAFADEVLAVPERDHDAFDGRFVGGSWAADSFGRPAFDQAGDVDSGR
jgi:uronate dehydrogenase